MESVGILTKNTMEQFKVSVEHYNLCSLICSDLIPPSVRGRTK